ncbi:MAG: fumarylacetoacetase [Actinomycetota bacterium]|nr:fumarylacetoacetase [Actinomycetota bacterium]
MSSWVPGAAGSGYDVDHLPFGVFSAGDDSPRVGIRIGAYVLDLAPLGSLQLVDGAQVFRARTLNPFLAAGPAAWREIRDRLTTLLSMAEHRDTVEPFLLPLADVELVLPLAVGDYVDFYCSEHHASNVGAIVRPGEDRLPEAWRHLPIGYHGHSGTMAVSGSDVRRPCGQRRGDVGPEIGPAQRLDLEAEVGFVVGVASARGDRVPTSAFADHVFGVTLLNDWSARDIQAWEYVPLGPSLSKSFATSVAAWITPLVALNSARVPLPGQDPAPQAYLAVREPAGYDIDLEVWINDTLVATPGYASTYWSPAQMLAHLTVNGASLRPGDLFASGTVSGPQPDQRGSLLELCWGGTEPITLGDGTQRTFLEDGDVVTLTATAPGALGGSIRLAEVVGRVLPATPF